MNINKWSWQGHKYYDEDDDDDDDDDDDNHTAKCVVSFFHSLI